MALGTPVAAAFAYSVSGGGTVTPAYPAGIAAGDALVLIIGQKPTAANGGTVTTPSGWTLREELTGAGGYGTTIGVDVGNTNLRIYTKDTVTGSESGTLSVTMSGSGVSFACIVLVPAGGATLLFSATDGSDDTAGNVSVTGAADPGFEPGDVALWAMCIPTDVSTPTQFSAHAITATGATFAAATELGEADTTNGSDLGGFLAWASVSSGASSGAPTITATAGGTTTNVRGPVGILRIRALDPVISTLNDAVLEAAGQALTSSAATISLLGAATIEVGGQVLGSQNGTTASLTASAIALEGQAVATIAATVSALGVASMAEAGQSLATTTATTSALAPATIDMAGQAPATIRATVAALASAVLGHAGQAAGTIRATVAALASAVLGHAGQAVDGSGVPSGAPPAAPGLARYGIFYGY